MITFSPISTITNPDTDVDPARRPRLDDPSLIRKLLLLSEKLDFQSSIMSRRGINTAGSSSSLTTIGSLLLGSCEQEEEDDDLRRPGSFVEFSILSGARRDVGARCMVSHVDHRHGRGLVVKDDTLIQQVPLRPRCSHRDRDHHLVGECVIIVLGLYDIKAVFSDKMTSSSPTGEGTFCGCPWTTFFQKVL